MAERTIDLSVIKRPEPKHPFDPAVYRLFKNKNFDEEDSFKTAICGYPISHLYLKDVLDMGPSEESKSLILNLYDRYDREEYYGRKNY